MQTDEPNKFVSQPLPTFYPHMTQDGTSEPLLCTDDRVKLLGVFALYALFFYVLTIIGCPSAPSAPSRRRLPDASGRLQRSASLCGLC
jgi:hypothetical protein